MVIKKQREEEKEIIERISFQMEKYGSHIVYLYRIFCARKRISLSHTREVLHALDQIQNPRIIIILCIYLYVMNNEKKKNKQMMLFVNINK